MEERTKKTSTTISGKEHGEVREDLLKKILRLKEKIAERYERLYKASSADHVRIMIEDIARKEREDRELIERAIETGTLHGPSGNVDRRDFDMIDHLLTEDISNVNVNDLKSVLMSAMKMTNDLHNILAIMANEYTEEGIRTMLETAAAHELDNKNRIAELYDEYINKDYW